MVNGVSGEDRDRWDTKHSASADDVELPGLPNLFAPHAASFPTRGRALELACGRGQLAVWLAVRGLDVYGVDVSPVAIGLARELAQINGVSDRCRFEVADLDKGLPPGPPVDVLVCHRFRDVALYSAMVERLGPGGLLAIAVLSQAATTDQGHRARFRAPTGELANAFADLVPLASDEADDVAWLMASKPVSMHQSTDPAHPRGQHR